MRLQIQFARVFVLYVHDVCMVCLMALITGYKRTARSLRVLTEGAHILEPIGAIVVINLHMCPV